MAKFGVGCKYHDLKYSEGEGERGIPFRIGIHV